MGPVFAATGWTLLAWINIPIYFLGENVCPQPALVFYVLDQPMVVCSRCWSAVFGLWTVLLIYKGTAGGSFWRMWLTRPEFLRVSVAVAAFWPWVLDIIAAERGWWFSSHPFMMLSGYLAGLAAGALLLPLAAKKISARS